jgi:3-hydroxy-9,10-secoandrosta-1,3,5(10)-triene-9,17-dione monooxygenase
VTGSVEAIERAVSAQDLVARAEALLPNILERAARTDAERRIPPETVCELRDARLFRIEQPPAFGGFGMRQLDRIQVSRTLARACGSTGWVHAVLAGHSSLIAQFSPDVRQEVWGKDDEALASSAFAPTGRMARSDGGYRLEGRFPFSSGCELAQWALVGTRATDEGDAPKLALVPMASLQILDDWQTLGLRGTGSKTLQASDVFVPANRVLPAAKLDATTAPLSLCAVAVGMAEGAIDRFVEHVVGRVSPVTGLKASDSEIIQAVVAEASAEVDAAWLLIERDIRFHEALAAAGKAASDSEKARLRRDQGYVGRLVTRAVERLYAACGGSAAYDKTPLQRVFRDVQTGALHPSMNWEVAAPQAGRVLLKSEFVSLF